MTFMQPGGGPSIKGVNLLSGAGSKVTDPLNVFPAPPPPPPPQQPYQAPAWNPSAGHLAAKDAQGQAAKAQQANAAGQYANTLLTPATDTNVLGPQKETTG